MNLKHLTDKVLISETKRLVKEERELTTEILHHLKEIDARKLFSDYGYPSMMAYAIKELQYSEGSASRGIQAARVLGSLPEIEDKINDGTLSLSSLSKASGHFNRENIKDPIKRRAVLKKLENKTTRECDKTLLELVPAKPLPRESLKIITPNLQQLKVNVSDETLKALSDARSLLGMFALDNEFMLKLSTEALDNIKRKKFKVTSRPLESMSPQSRYVSHQSKRDVAEKSGGVCEKCGTLFMLQFDHREPFSLGGTSESTNMRLLCFQCNQRARIRAGL